MKAASLPAPRYPPDMRGALVLVALLAGCGPGEATDGDGANVNLHTGGGAGGEVATREDPMPFVRRGMALVQEQQCERAMAEGFGPALAIFEQAHPADRGAPRASRIVNAAGVSSLNAPTEAGTTEADIGSSWSDTMYLQAFCLVELGRTDEAGALLQRALTILPNDLVYSCELGHIRQREQRFDEAMVLYRGALENARMLVRSRALGGTSLFGQTLEWWVRRALRGIGFTQVELGQLVEAEATYRQVLEIDPNDAGAIRELQLIATRRGAI